jgi:hypothetical protein
MCINLNYIAQCKENNVHVQRTVHCTNLNVQRIMYKAQFANVQCTMNKVQCAM